MVGYAYLKQNLILFNYTNPRRHMEKYLQRQSRPSKQQKISPLRRLRQYLENNQTITDEILS